ncbi:zonular occludens toxin domain-containing protein [Rheinheimera texasensis]|uniref:zonular occludens toxin domain-containing protein n=1 Tax=Rheinheimera texasensis TaxID=306205 RepID=UPI0032B18B61
MINGLSGRPGSGKSYEAVIRHIMPALLKQRKVVTNIPLNVDWFCSVVGEHCRDLIVQIEGGFHNYGGKRYFSDAEHFLRYQDWRNEENQGVFFVVDECHLCMPRTAGAGEDRVSTQQELKEYLSMHRHYGHDILLLSQNFRKVDRDVVDMIQNCYYTIKKSFLGQDDKYICKVADGVSRNIVATHEREYEPKYFAAYQSHTKSVGSVTEAKTVDVKPWWQNKFFGMAAALLIALVALLALLSSQIEESKQRKADILAKNTLNKPAPAPAVQQQQQAQPVAPVAQAKPSVKAEEGPQPKKHPLDGLQMHLTATAEDWTRHSRYQKTIYVAVSRNGQMLKEITAADLALAGYQWTLLNDCMLEIKYNDVYQDWIFCDAPTQEVQFTKTAKEETAG